MRLTTKKVIAAAFAGMMITGAAACSSDSSTTSPSDNTSSSASEQTNEDILKGIVDVEKIALDVEKEAKKAEFSDMQVAAKEPNGIVYTYTFANKVDKATETAKIEAAEADLKSKTDVINSQLTKIGIKDPFVSVTYLNSDGTDVWSKTYTAE